MTSSSEKLRTEQLNEEFQYNFMLAKALVQVLPARERTLMRTWFDKLYEMDTSQEEMVIRNEYVWFILLMLQNNKILDYFKTMPPYDLPPLRNIVDQSTIDEILLDADQNMSWLEALLATKIDSDEDTKPHDDEPQPSTSSASSSSSCSNHHILMNKERQFLKEKQQQQQLLSPDTPIENTT